MLPTNTTIKSNGANGGVNQPAHRAPVKPGAWQRFTAACSRIAESFLRDSDRFCGDCAGQPPPTQQAPAVPFVHVQMLVGDKVVKKLTKRRITVAMLRKAGPEFKSSMLKFQENLQKSLPTVAEETEYETLSSDSSLFDQSLAEQFADMGDFNFDEAPNPFPSVGKSRHADYSPGAAKPFDRRETGRPQRIVDHVPSSFPVSKQQMLINFRGKIIAENYMTTRLVNIHNEIALTKFLGVLEKHASDNSVASLDGLTPSQAHSLFEHFCQALKVSPFRKGYGDV